ncbi:cytochrome P450/oxidoreductase [Roseitranquillus sediminis]|uniref:cytochrome P450/oxidoreductase n=1 Tax=Roseitranquillus sediminis TaxID=2809051 RepID=UPI001D0C6C03|nr:cytochrome P450/oxidoreductase [Roseitranquillus sediminis]MBM9595403.1 cytochrome P450/oxidoreductase [Roseitranquillus sediminis]
MTATAASSAPAAAGCPVSDRAAAFDPFDAAYQTDPAAALVWAREEEPVFYAPRLGYWVVTRYDDVKAIFRDPILFSPRIALEKITPVGQEAQDVLASYGYAMNRTLVNEDEPAHMERRRALMEHFIPENLARREATIRRLTREKVDAFIDRGRADLMDEMLWEIPLTVALDFLGVPEEDMARLRAFSVAHTVNTWGRPTPEQQVEVAHAVGRFWRFAGEVLERMRANPDGPGWMHYAIRRNAEMPEVVTDSYLHSMMMAIIVAAHETTALASANAMKALLADRAAWDRLCADPALIPNAVEECLRAVGSVVAWRRQTTAPARVGGVDIPKGAKLLLVQASANRDPRHFEDGETLDIWRDNAVDHLTFGYGAHQCMGKNIARMEMRIFVEEFTRRLPHMRLAEQAFTYLPNTSFRGPDHVWVEWDPAENPERRDPSLREGGRSFPIGAPLRKDIARTVRVVEVRQEAEGVLGVVLEDRAGRLPDWSAGAHVEIEIDGTARYYSLCGPAGDGRATVAILREEGGRGGSRLFHERLRPGVEIKLRGPRNHFRLDEGVTRHVLIAGGIGITPVLAMADRLKALGRDYELHYAGRSRGTMAFLYRIARDHGERATLYPSDEGRRADLAALISSRGDGGQICACGPDRMIEALKELTADLPPGAFAFEHFTGGDVALDPAKEQGFDVELVDSGLSLHVPPDRTLLSVLRGAGIDLPSDCEEGLCGTCECAVVTGEVDHRDKVLSAAERAAGDRMMTCCSRSRDGQMLRIAV